VIHHDTTYAEYLALPGYRWSEIKCLHDGGPLHVQHARTASDSGDTASRAWLRAVHCLALEPHNFGREFSVYDGIRRGRLYEAHVVCHPGTTALTPAQKASAQAAADAVRSHPTVGPLLAEGHPEVVVTWTDAPTGLACKARIDWLGAALLDLKTLGTTHERRVAGMTATRLYHGQLAHYAAGLAAHGIVVPAYLVVAEGAPPHDVAAFELDPRGPDGALFVGARVRAKLLERIAECERTGRWPGRHDAPVDLVLPTYALDDSAEEITA
jgi:hypothetical protein